MPSRVVMSRRKGYRKPEGAVYVGRPSKWGNPFPLDGPWITWTAVGLGYMGDKNGRRDAAVALYRGWMTAEPIVASIVDDPRGGHIEFSGGAVVSLDQHCRGIALGASTFYDAPSIPERPDPTELAGKDLMCWCGVGLPCHADVLLELANQRGKERR